MELTVEIDSPVPVYEQIRAQVTEIVESGRLGARAPLPSVRQLASDLQIAPGTVARAYQELESGGIVTCSRWAGTRVADITPVERAERRRRVDELATRMVAASRRLGAGDDEIAAALTRAMRRTNQRSLHAGS